jgi:hypothetical protein
MAKIPVGATIASAFGFAFGGFFNLLRLMWLPLVIVLACSYAVLPMLAGAVQGMATNPLAFLSAAPLFLAFYAVALVLMFMQITAIAQSALGLETGSRWFYFSLAAPMWRLAGAAVLATLIIAAAYVIVFLGGIVAGIVGRMLATPAVAIMIAGGVVTVLFCALIYVMLRLTFLLTPVVIAERRIGIGRSWTLGKGNFWRMFAVLLVIFLPFLVIEFAAMGWLLGGLPPIHPGAPPAAATAAFVAWETGMFQRMRDFWYFVYPASAIFSILLYGSFVGAQCFAYRALMPRENNAEIFS